MKFISNTIRFFFLLISFFSLYIIGAILYGMATEHHFPDQLRLSEELELLKLFQTQLLSLFHGI